MLLIKCIWEHLIQPTEHSTASIWWQNTHEEVFPYKVSPFHAVLLAWGTSGNIIQGPVMSRRLLRSATIRFSVAELFNFSLEGHCPAEFSSKGSITLHFSFYWLTFVCMQMWETRNVLHETIHFLHVCSKAGALYSGPRGPLSCKV